MATAVFNDEEKIEFQQQIVEALKNPEAISNFTAGCKNIGQTAFSIDAFNRIKGDFDDILKNYIKDFPEAKNFTAQWDAFGAHWNEILFSSRDLAIFTANQLNVYDQVFLAMIEQIETGEDLKEIQAELKKFSTEQHPGGIETGVADSFKKLGNDIQKFSTDIQKNFDDKKQIPDKDAKRLQGVIKGLQDEIDTLNEQIGKILIGSGCFAALGLTGFLTTAGTVLSALVHSRKSKQDQLKEAQSQLADVNSKQKALAHLQSDLDISKPDIVELINKLSIIAEVWASARSQAGDFANKLDGGLDVTRQPAFRLTVELSRKTCALLAEGLKGYATSVGH